MPEERDPVYRWIAAHPWWVGLISVALMLCIAATIGGFAFLAATGALSPTP